MIVIKIGGSSLDTDDKLNCILEIIKKYEDKKIIVVSAIGRYPLPYATNTLITMCEHVSKKEQDLLISTGEIISSIVFSDFLNSNDIKSIALSPYDFSINCIDREKIISTFEDYECIIIPGFVYTIDNVIYTLPRGGSNISCALLAAEFSKELIIITDLCGIYDKNPNCNEAKMMDRLTYDELISLRKGDLFFPVSAIEILKAAQIITYFIKYNNNEKYSIVLNN